MPRAALQSVITKHTPEQAFGVFLSGATAAYLNRRYYGAPFPSGYENAVKDVVSRPLASEVEPDGMVKLVFNRIFIIAAV